LAPPSSLLARWWPSCFFPKTGQRFLWTCVKQPVCVRCRTIRPKPCPPCRRLRSCS
jgi:hypothetical protein